MTLQEIADAIPALDAWFKSQDIEDKYAAIIVAELVAYHMSRNFDEENIEHMAGAFKALFDKSMLKYFRGKDKNEAKRLN